MMNNRQSRMAMINNIDDLMHIVSSAKFIDNVGKFLVETGLLFKINREILNPLGLTLAVVLDQGDKTLNFKIWDNRDVPENAIFSDLKEYKNGCKKLKKYMDEFGTKTERIRENKLGFKIQPLPINN